MLQEMVLILTENMKGKIYKLVGVYSDPNRDPRGHFVSVCFVVKCKGELRAGSDAKEVGLFDLKICPNSPLTMRR